MKNMVFCLLFIEFYDIIYLWLEKAVSYKKIVFEDVKG